MNHRLALRNLLELLGIGGVSGEEQQAAGWVSERLREAGCAARSIIRQPPPPGGFFKTGNLIADLPGNVAGRRILFSAHLDTVPLCAAAVPVKRGGRIAAKGGTALGGDDRAGVACILTMVQTILEQKLPHPPITLLFTVGEELGLQGSKMVTRRMLKNPMLGFNFDGGGSGDIVIGAIGARRWEATITGIAAHAGVSPERGVSAALIFAEAVAALKAKGLWGRVSKGRRRGTANLGLVRGGQATNQVMEALYLKGESRSHEPRFAREITSQIQKAFVRSARKEKNTDRRSGRVKFRSWSDYAPFRLRPDHPVVDFTRAAMLKLGMKPRLQISDGGLDANNLNRKGIPTVTLGAGNHKPHSLEEYVDIEEYFQACRLAIALAQGRG